MLLLNANAQGGGGALDSFRNNWENGGKIHKDDLQHVEKR